MARLLAAIVAASLALGAAPTEADTLPRFAFTTGCCVGGHGVAVHEPDGRVVSLVETDKILDAQPAWSPDGTKIAYAIRGPEGSQVRLVDPGGTGDELLALLPGWATFDLEWSPSGTWMALSGATPSAGVLWYQPYVQDVVLLRVSTGAVVPVEVVAGSPTWAPNADHLAYSGPHGLSVRVVDDFGPMAPTVIIPTYDGTARHLRYFDNLTWSPDGERLAFVSQRVGGDPLVHRALLGVVDVDGSHEVRFSQWGWGRPTWSPDGTRVAVSTERGLEVVDRRGGQPSTILAPLDRDEVLGIDVHWSLDGTWLVQHRQPTHCCQGQVWLVAADGTQQRMVAQGRGLMRVSLAPAG